MNMEDQEKIISAFKSVCEGRPVSECSLNEVAHEAGVSLKQIRRICPTRMDLIDLYLSQVNEQVIAGYDADEDEKAKDRLFDLLMGYFDALNEDREFILKLENYIRKKPHVLLRRRSLISQLFRRFLICAGVNDQGLTGRMRSKGLEAIFWSVYTVWRQDLTEDMSKTMAVLDKRLSQADTCLIRVRCSGLEGGNG